MKVLTKNIKALDAIECFFIVFGVILIIYVEFGILYML